MTDSDNNDFDKLLEEYNRLKDSSNKTEAPEFYLERLLPQIIIAVNDDYVDRYDGEHFEILVTLLGDRIQTTLTSIELVKPTHIVVITSKEKLSQLARVKEWISKHSKAPPIADANIHYILVDSIVSQDIYSRAKAKIEEIQRQTDDHEVKTSVLCDITGGTKNMSAVTAYLAWNRSYKVAYLQFDGTIGSEKFYLLGRPEKVMAERDFDEAVSRFDDGDYKHAEKKFADVAGRLVSPEKAYFGRELSDVYKHWREFQVTGPKFFEKLKRLEVRLEGMPQIREATRKKLTLQIRTLRIMSSSQTETAGDRHYSLTSFFLLAKDNMKQQRKAFAAMLYYRTLEGCLKFRLESRIDGFKCNKPDWEKFEGKIPRLSAKFQFLAKVVHEDSCNISLPPRVGLMSAALCLILLQDNMVKDEVLSPNAMGKTATEEDVPRNVRAGRIRKWRNRNKFIATLSQIEFLCKLLECTSCRNQSILAHGMEPVQDDALENLAAITKSILQFQHTKCMRINKQLPTFENFVERMMFVRFPEA